MTPEGKIKVEIKKYLLAQYPKALTYFPVANKFSTIGASDILVCINGKFIALEVKTQTNHATKLQELFIERVIAAGGVAGVVRSVDDVIHLLDGKV
jgi:hypothetical protein